MNQFDGYLNLIRKASTIQEARQTIAQSAGPVGLLLYQISDAAEKLNDSIHDLYFPFDFTDEQVELYHALLKIQAKQTWSGLDLKMVVFLVLGPSARLNVLCSTFKKKPKNLHMAFELSPSSGDHVLAPGPPTPCVPILLQPGTPDTPNEPFRPLTQCLDPRSTRTNSYNHTPVRKNHSVAPFSLNLSTISATTPVKLRQSTPDSVGHKSHRSNSSFGSNSSRRRSPIIKPRKRYTPSPTPKNIRERNSRILDGLEPATKKPKLDKNQRKKAKARRSMQNWFLSNLFQQ